MLSGVTAGRLAPKLADISSVYGVAADVRLILKGFPVVAQGLVAGSDSLEIETTPDSLSLCGLYIMGGHGLGQGQRDLMITGAFRGVYRGLSGCEGGAAL